MSLMKHLFVRNFNRITPFRLSVSWRFFNESITMKEKQIPEISEDDSARDLFKVIDEYSTVESETPYGMRQKIRSIQTRKFVSKRRNKLQKMLSDSDHYHPVIYSILSAKTGSEITDLLNNINVSDYSHDETCEEDTDDVDSKNIDPTIHRIHSKAIRCAADLGEFAVAWDIFEQCKTKQILSNELYNTMMWCCMYEARNEQSLEQVFALYDELNQVITDHGLSIHPRTYSTLINSCVKLYKFDKALRVLHEVKTKHPEVLNHSRVRQAVLTLLLKSLHIDEAIELVNNAPDGEDMAWANFRQYRISEILYALASNKLMLRSNSQDYVQKAETVFKKSLSAAITHDVEIPFNMFNGMIHVYAKAQDFDSCYVLLEYMTDPKQKHKLFPSPTYRTFEHMVSALEDHPNNDDKWKKIDKMYKLMGTCDDVRRSEFFYRILLDVCDDNIDKAQVFYDDMVNVHKIEPNVNTLKNLFAVGMNHYGKNTQQLQEFTRYIIDQHSEYNITPTEDIRQQWKVAMNT
eukprot:55668_1